MNSNELNVCGSLCWNFITSNTDWCARLKLEIFLGQQNRNIDCKSTFNYYVSSCVIKSVELVEFALPLHWSIAIGFKPLITYSNLTEMLITNLDYLENDWWQCTNSRSYHVIWLNGNEKSCRSKSKLFTINC